jgi:exopolyphosphatase/guanosine-5'-triphosphate,3'-diphosphate pyrophosphatase
VARVSLALFDQTRALHGMTDREREWLEYAALMHDLGAHISYPKHHKHSHYLIKNGDLRGFGPDEIDVIALVARYHRRGTPKKTHPDFAHLTPPLRRAVKLLSSILRLAENLDRSHAQVVSAVELRDRGDDFLLQMSTSSDAELEVWAAHRHAKPFERLLGKPLHLEVAPPAGRTAAQV